MENERAKWRLARWIACFLGVIAALIALFYFEENWRGKHAWENYQRSRVAAGDHLPNDFAWYLPKPVPDDENFYKTPLLQSIGYGRRRNPKNDMPPEVTRRLDQIACVNYGIGSIVDQKRCDLVLAQAALRSNADLNLPPLPRNPAADIAQVMEQSPELNELREASLRPFAQCNALTNPESEFDGIPNFVNLRIFAQSLTVSAAAELALNHPEKAARDEHVLEQIVNALHGNQTLVSSMIRTAIASLPVEIFWEGWEDGKWSDQQLEQFQKFFDSANLIADVDRSFHTSEKAGIEFYILKPRKLIIKDFFPRPENLKSGESIAMWLTEFAPQGWFYQNLVVHHQMIDELIDGTSDPANRREFPEIVKANMERYTRFTKKKNHGLFGILAAIAIPNTARAFTTTAQNQTFLEEAAIVCALERFRHANGQYPDTLDELTPKFMSKLPQEVVDGAPYHYRKTGWKFELYSVGWNGQDQGGKPGRNGSGDWVWPSPKTN